MGTILKKSSKNFMFIEFGEIDYSLHFYFYGRKQNKCVHVLFCDIIKIKEDCCWLLLFFFNSVLSLILFYIQSINRQLLAAKK